jgi:hypothetical protein
MISSLPKGPVGSCAYIAEVNGYHCTFRNFPNN